MAATASKTVLLGVLLATSALAQNARLVLRWKAVAGAASYRLQISAEPTFAKPIVDAELKEPTYKWAELPSSTHYWRVRSIDGEGRPGEWSAPQALATATANVKPKAPVDNASVGCSEAIELSAEESNLVQDFVFELATDVHFQEGLKSAHGATASQRFTGLGPGVYFWRVRGTDLKGRSTEATAPRKLTLQLAAPKPKAVGEVQFPQPITLSFGEVGCAKGYVIEASREGSEVVKLDGLASPITFKPGAPGEYRWKVFAIDARGVRGSGSAEMVMRVKLPAPQVRLAEGTNGVPDLRWPAVDKAVSYRVEVLLPEGREPLAVGTLMTPGWRANGLKPGSYTVRLFARDATGKLSFPAELKGVMVGEVPTLASPVLLSPEPGSEVALAEHALLALRWTAVAEAARYSVQLDNETPLASDAAELKVPNVALGPHTVKLRAANVDGKKLSGWSEAFAFTVVAPKVAVVEPPPPPASWIFPLLNLSARVGGRFNFGAIDSPEGTLALSWRPRFARGYAGLALSAGVYAAGATTQLDDLTVVGRAQLVPIGLQLQGHYELSGFRLRAGVGPTLQLGFFQVNAATETRVAPALDVSVAVAHRLGPGVLELELGWRAGHLEGLTARLNAGGVGIALGYGFDLLSSEAASN